jgi:hypothetical protein
MRRQMNPVAVIVMILITIAAFIIAFIVKGHLPESVEAFKGLIFWGIVVVIGGGGAVLSGKFMNKED